MHRFLHHDNIGASFYWSPVSSAFPVFCPAFAIGCHGEEGDQISTGRNLCSHEQAARSCGFRLQSLFSVLSHSQFGAGNGPHNNRLGLLNEGLKDTRVQGDPAYCETNQPNSFSLRRHHALRLLSFRIQNRLPSFIFSCRSPASGLITENLEALDLAI